MKRLSLTPKINQMLLKMFKDCHIVHANKKWSEKKKMSIDKNTRKFKMYCKLSVPFQPIAMQGKLPYIESNNIAS